MGRGLQGALLKGFGGRDHEATVLEVSRVAPHFVRITMSSPTLFQDVTVEPTAFLRFWFPDHQGGDSEFQRVYTIVWAEPDSGRFAVDVVLHEPSGPASHWAARAEPGMTLPVVSLGSRGFHVPDELPAGFLLIGDSASIPAINSILAVVPVDVDVEVYLERHSADDHLIPIADHPRRGLHWVDRTDDLALAAAIEDRDWSDWYAWAGPEAGSLKHLRKRLREAFGFPKTDLHAQAYWTQGREMGSRRDSEDKPTTTEVAAETTVTSVTETAAPKGRWRSQAAKDLLAPVKPQLIATGVLELMITLLQLAPFVVLVELARQLLAGADESALRGTLIAFVVLLGVGAVLSAGVLLWLHVVDMRFSAAVRRRLLDKLARVPLGWFTQRGSGAVKKLIQDDTLSLHYLVTHAVSDAVAAVIAPLAVLVYLFVVDWRLALILLLPILIYIITTSTMVYQSGPKITEASRWAERMNGEAAAYLEGQPVIRVFGGAAASSFRRSLDGYIEFLNIWQRPFIGKKTFMDLATRPSTFLWLIACAGTFFVTSGAMEPTTLLPFLVLGTTFGTRLLGIAFGFGGLREGMQAARRIAVTLDEDELVTMQLEASGMSNTVPSGTVTFENVGFGYRAGVPVIHDLSLTLCPGTVTALVGPSGSGKSTLAALLARFHDVETGAIRIDGRDVRSLTPDDLYTKVGFVFQDVQLVHGTVHENIALARPDANAEEVRAAATDAQIHEQIMRLACGYDTVLGANSQLSGGERQRLTIARALLADAPILIMDEATAFADPESEYLVQQALGRLIRNRTVLVIAHRLHTITEAEQIVVLDHGRIAESGTHPQLLSVDGRYRQLWDSRLGEARTHGALTGETTR